MATNGTHRNKIKTDWLINKLISQQIYNLHKPNTICRPPHSAIQL